MEHAGLIIKATRLCNLRCAYCHDWRTGRDQRMPFRVLAAMTRAALGDPEHRSVDFIWHGGETTLMPIAFYRKAIYLQERLRRPEQIVTNVIQTNGTRLTTEWMEFFKAYDFRVGISLDGPPELHDRHRRLASGRPSSPLVAKGIELLRRYRVPFTVLLVVDEDTLALGPRRVFDALVEMNVKQFSLLNAKPTNQPAAPRGTATEHYVDPPRMTEFLCGIYDAWREHGDEEIDIRELRSLEGRLAGGASGVCTLAGGCLGRYYLVEPNGEVAHCDLFLGDVRYTFGNVLASSFADFRNGRPMARLREENERQLTEMRGCPEFGVCNGWCPHERYLSVRHNLDHDDACCGLRPVIGHIRARQGDLAAAPA